MAYQSICSRRPSLFIGLVTALLAGSAMAQTPEAAPAPAPAAPGPVAACFQAPAALSPDAMAEFLAAPDSILDDHAMITLSARARALAGSDPAAIDALVQVALKGTVDQRAAIGAGLARAAQSCVATRPDYAALIQQKVAASNLAEMVTAFISASNDVQTAALGTAAASPAAAPGIANTGRAGPGSGEGADTSFPTAGPPSVTANPGRFFDASGTRTNSVSPS